MTSDLLWHLPKVSFNSIWQLATTFGYYERSVNSNLKRVYHSSLNSGDFPFGGSIFEGLFENTRTFDSRRDSDVADLHAYDPDFKKVVIKVVYNVTKPSQIGKAFWFRELLRVNNLPFTENMSVESAVNAYMAQIREAGREAFNKTELEGKEALRQAGLSDITIK